MILEHLILMPRMQRFQRKIYPGKKVEIMCLKIVKHIHFGFFFYYWDSAIHKHLQGGQKFLKLTFDFFPIFELPNSRCGSSAGEAYTIVFTVLYCIIKIGTPFLMYLVD